jgi:hypothetical protein
MTALLIALGALVIIEIFVIRWYVKRLDEALRVVAYYKIQKMQERVK